MIGEWEYLEKASEETEDGGMIGTRIGDGSSKRVRKKSLYGWPLLFVYVLVCVVVCVLPNVSIAGDESDKPLALGKGIRISQEDVNGFRTYMEKRKFRTNEAQLLKVLIRLTLFAAEAEKLSLKSDREFGVRENAELERTISLSELYIGELQREYPVGGLIIESYVFSHPDKFPLDKGEDFGITDKQSETVRWIVRNAKRSEIAKNAYESLLKEYQIQLTGGAK